MWAAVHPGTAGGRGRPQANAGREPIRRVFLDAAQGIRRVDAAARTGKVQAARSPCC